MQKEKLLHIGVMMPINISSKNIIAAGQLSWSLGLFLLGFILRPGFANGALLRLIAIFGVCAVAGGILLLVNNIRSLYIWYLMIGWTLVFLSNRFYGLQVLYLGGNYKGIAVLIYIVGQIVLFASVVRAVVDLLGVMRCAK